MQAKAETNEFKETEIGLIPEDWKLVTLGHVSELIMGQSPPSSAYNTARNGLPFFQGKAEFGDLFPAPSKWCSKPIKIARQKDVLISVRAPVGDVNIAPFECCIGRGLAAIRAKTDLDSLYLFYYLATAKKRLESEGRGTTFKAIGKSVLENFKLPLPSFLEQQRIAHVLSRIQQAIKRQDKIIEATKNLKKSLMQKLFTEGIGHTEFKDSEIGQIPKNWEVVRLGEVVTDFFGGGTPSTTNREYWDGEIPWMTSAFITGLYVGQGQRYITKKGLENSATTLIPKNNILIGTRVGTGKVAINLVDIAISQDLTGAIVDRKKVLLEYLAYALLSQKVQEQIHSKNRGVTIKGITREDLKATLIPIAPLTEQSEISHSLNRLDHKTEAEGKRKTVLQQIFKTMLHKLMTGEIRVKDIDLGVYDVN